MSSKLSVAQVVSNLEARLAFHRKQEELHAQQEVHHREQRAVHAAETQRVQARLETFRSAADSLEDLAEGPVPGQTPQAEAPDFGPGQPKASPLSRSDPLVLCKSDPLADQGVSVAAAPIVGLGQSTSSTP